MKSVLLFSMILGGLLFTNSSRAQSGACSIYDLLFQNVEVVDDDPLDGTCTVRFDLAFSMDVNPGNKFVYFQSYIQSATLPGNIPANNPHSYPDYFECEEGNSGEGFAPDAEDAGNPLLNIAIDLQGSEPAFTNYVPDPLLAIMGVVDGLTTIESVTLANGDTRFLITGLEMVLPNECALNPQYNFIIDIFSSQAGNGRILHCISCGILATFGALEVTGVLNCDMVNATITNVFDSDLSVTYELYVDNGDGVLATENSLDILVDSLTVDILAGAAFGINYTAPDSLLGREVFVVVNIGDARRAELLPLIECVPLPVSFGSFNAQRNRSNVVLTWETETESNSRGFELQRELGDNKWQAVAFIPSKAEGGNSTSVIKYEYTDLNTYRGISNYRIRQVDFDGQMMISPVRSVRGDGQPNGTLIFPNPSSNGQVNVIFESVRDQMELTLVDMAGRVLKQWQNYSDNSLQINNLQPGVYNLRVINRNTGVVSSEKIVVSGK